MFKRRLNNDSYKMSCVSSIAIVAVVVVVVFINTKLVMKEKYFGNVYCITLCCISIFTIPFLCRMTLNISFFIVKQKNVINSEHSQGSVYDNKNN